MATATFDPSQPFEVEEFDESQPFDAESSGPVFDASQPFEVESGLESAQQFGSDISKSVARGATSEGLLAISEGAYRGLATALSNPVEIPGGSSFSPSLSPLVTPAPTQQQIERQIEQGTQSLPETALPQPIQETVDYLRDTADEAGRLRETVREALPVSKEFQSSYPGMIATGFGQLVNIPAYAVPGLGAAATVAQVFQEGYDDAIQSGATPEAAERAAIKYTATSGPIDAFADKLIAGRAVKAMVNQPIKDVLKEIAKIGATQGATEGVQQLALNAVAKYLEGYDPERSLDEGVLDSTLVGLGVGLGGATISEGVGRASRPPIAEQVKEVKVTGLDSAAIQANENSSPMVAQELSKQANEIANAPTAIVAPQATQIDHQIRREEILENLLQDEQQTPRVVEGDERFAPPAEVSNQVLPEETEASVPGSQADSPIDRTEVLRQASINAENLYTEDPDQVGQSSLRDWRNTLSPEIASQFQAHGAPIGELQSILEGIDQDRPFYTAPLNDSTDGLGLRDIGTGGQVLVLGGRNQGIKEGGVQAVVVNDYLVPSLPQLQSAYPEVTWLTPQTATQWINEQPTGLAQPSNAPENEAQSPQAGVTQESQTQIQEPEVSLNNTELITENAPQTISQQEGVQAEREAGNQIRETAETSGSDSLLNPAQEQEVDEGTQRQPVRGPIQSPVAEVPAISSVPESAGPQFQRVQIGSSPQTHQVIEVLPQSDIERENGEQYFRIRNERTGEEQTVEKGDIRPVKGKVAEDAIKPQGEAINARIDALPSDQKSNAFKLNNEGGSILVPDMQDIRDAVRNVADALNQAYDNFTDWSGAMVRTFGEKVGAYLKSIYNFINTGGGRFTTEQSQRGSLGSADLNPANPQSKSTRMPFRKTDKSGRYQPEGIWSAAGKWNKEIFKLLGQKERNVAANLNAVEFLSTQLRRERNKAEKAGAPIDPITLNTALGNIQNNLTDAQYAQARSISNEEARQKFERDAKLQNLEQARIAQAEAMDSLPESVQNIIAEMRDRIDQLSQQLRDSGAVSGDIKAAIDDNLGLYLHRSYSIFDNAEAWKNFIKSDDPQAVQIRNKAENLFLDYAKADAARGLYNDAQEAGTPISRKEALAQAEGLDVSAQAALLLDDYLSIADDGAKSVLGGRLPGQKNRSIVTMRGQIPQEIRDLWGEQADATTNFAKTFAGISTFLENHRFLNEVLNQGLITEDNPNGYIWKEGESPEPRPRGFVQLVGDGSKTMEPINGAWMPPELTEAFETYYQNRSDYPALLRWAQAATGLSMKSKTAWSWASTMRNFFGNVAFMTANGNLNISKLSDAQKTAWNNLTKGGDKTIRNKIEEYIRLGVIGDNVGPMLLKEISEAANIEKAGDKFTAGHPLLTKLWRSGKNLKGVDDAATGLYGSVDDFWKVFAFENELEKVKQSYPDETEQQQKERAATIVRDTVPTYSLAPEIVRNLKSNFGVVAAPFITFTTEVLRTTYNTVRTGVNEIKEGNATNNKALRDAGIKRLVGFAATQGFFPALALLFKQAFDYDDQDEDAVREFLPDWQKNAQLLLIGRDEKGDPRYIDVSFLDPYGYLKEPIIAAMVQSRSGKSADEIAKDATLASLKQIAEPFLSEQILAGAIMDIARNTKANGAELTNTQDSVTRQWYDRLAHVLKAFEPGTLTSLGRIYKGASGQSGAMGPYSLPNELSSFFLGQRVSSVDPRTSLDIATRRYVRDNQDAASLLNRELKSRGTVGEGVIVERYQAANRAKEKNAQDIRDDYKAALTLGVPVREARKILNDSSISQDTVRDVVTGQYHKYRPSPQTLSEIRKSHPERIRELQEAISSTPDKVPLR